MNRHLNEQEVLDWLAGKQNAAAEEHVRQCDECRKELAGLGEAIAGFRATTYRWAESERQDVAVRDAVPSTSPRRFGMPRLQWAVAVLVLTVCVGLFLSRTRAVDPTGVPALLPAPIQTATDDAALLERVNEAMSRQVPSAMEPLAQLVPTERNSSAQEKAQEAN
jgi:hypothetical protein